MVPIAPSSTRMRSASSSRSALSDSFRFLIPALFSLELLVTSVTLQRPFVLPSHPSILRGFAPGIDSSPCHSQTSENTPNLSVTVREHLSPRPLPLVPAFTTLKYSGY